MTEISVLVVEDSFYSADLNIRELKKTNYMVHYKMVSSGKTMKDALAKDKWDLIISDNSMPDFSALESLAIRNSVDDSIPFIIVSEDISQREIDQAFKTGCTAYIAKENLTELRTVAANILNKI